MARTFATEGVDYLENGAAVLTAVPLTISGWVRPASLGTTQVVIVLSEYNSSSNYFGIVIHTDGRPYAQTKDGGGGAFAITASAALSVGVWSLITAVFASTTSRSIYIEGGSKVTNTDSATPTSIDRTLFGGRYNAGAGGAPEFVITGDAAEVGIWNVALSDAQVASLYVSAGVGIYPSAVQPSALQAYWKLLGTDSPEPDEIGNAHPFTVHGTSAATHLTMQGLGGGAVRQMMAQNEG